MNIAIILAGGTGNRMGQDIPKQFINVNDKPVLIYTLEGFERHDGIRPLVDESVLTDVIEKAQRYGNAVTSMPYNEQIFVVSQDDETTTTQYIPRETLRRVSTPQAYSMKLLSEKYDEAFSRGIGIAGSNYTNTMMVQLGVRLHFAAGSDKNIKLTTRDDLDLFKGYLAKKDADWMK